MHHLVLIGDSILDNAAYAAGGPAVITHLQRQLPDGWRASLGAGWDRVRNSDQVTVLRGHWDLVCIEISSGRARRMPPEFLAAYITAGGAGSIGHRPLSERPWTDAP
jgi:hypothetical protein